jgi:hypothetical protein
VEREDIEANDREDWTSFLSLGGYLTTLSVSRLHSVEAFIVTEVKLPGGPWSQK